MRIDQLNDITDWFDSFVATFRATSPAGQRNYNLKIEHTFRVRSIMERLANSLNLPPEERTLAAAIAICHDVGRFPQYRDYGTFNDATSTNHAGLAVRTLKAERVLDGLDPEQQSLILQAVALHNVFILPINLPPAVRRLALLIRDADKLDIWRVLIEYCTAGSEDRSSAVIWELPDTGACSRQALEEVAAGRMLNRTLLATADDFKLLQLSWVFDLNFNESFKIVLEQGYIETLAALLPGQPGSAEATTAVHEYIKSRMERQKAVGLGNINENSTWRGRIL